MGVTLFRVDAGEHVTSVFPVIEDAGDENGPDRMDAQDEMDIEASDRNCGSACIPARSTRSLTVIST